MGIFNKLAGSADLVNGMASRLGADMSSSIVNSPDTEAKRFRSAVIRCSACTDQDGCAELLSQNDHLDNAPEYCMNKQMLENMSK